MSKVKMAVSRLSVPELIERTREITTSMTGNVNFTTPSPALTVVDTAADDTEVAYNESRGRDKDKIAIMRLRRKALLQLLVQLAGYVQQASGNDEEKILSSGFDVMAPKTPRPDTAGVVTNLRLFDGSVPGKIKADWNKADDAVIYLIETSPTADFVTSELKGITTRSKKEVGDFTSGTRIWIRIVALGRENAGPASDPASILVK
jgi:hypothetical protein